MCSAKAGNTLLTLGEGRGAAASPLAHCIVYTFIQRIAGGTAVLRLEPNCSYKSMRIRTEKAMHAEEYLQAQV